MKKRNDPPAFRMPSTTDGHKEFIEAQEEGLAIDENALEEELQNQVPSYYEVSKRFAEAESRRDAAKHHLKVVEARVDDEIRRLAKEAGEKLTEVALAARLMTDEAVTQANNLYLDASAAYRDLLALKEAFTQRSYMLKELVALWIANYYGGDIEGRASRSVRSVNADNTKRATRERLRRD